MVKLDGSGDQVLELFFKLGVHLFDVEAGLALEGFLDGFGKFAQLVFVGIGGKKVKADVFGFGNDGGHVMSIYLLLALYGGNGAGHLKFFVGIGSDAQGAQVVLEDGY